MTLTDYRVCIVDHIIITLTQAVTISACGNFGIVGYADGEVHKYNIQSTLHRGQIGDIGGMILIIYP